MSLRFKAGEPAIVTIAMGDLTHLVGQIVEVVCVGPFPANHFFPQTGRTHASQPRDYLVRTGAGFHATTMDIGLRKLDALADPTATTRVSREEIEA